LILYEGDTREGHDVKKANRESDERTALSAGPSAQSHRGMHGTNRRHRPHHACLTNGPARRKGRALQGGKDGGLASLKKKKETRRERTSLGLRVPNNELLVAALIGCRTPCLLPLFPTLQPTWRSLSIVRVFTVNVRFEEKIWEGVEGREEGKRGKVVPGERVRPVYGEVEVL
jgi:hypothetical protein